MKRTVYGLVLTATFAVVHLAFAGVQEGLIAYWPLDEGEGDQWEDMVGDHDATVLQGGEWTDDAQVGDGFKFVGQTLVEVPDEDDINELPDGFTIAHWMNPASGGAIMDKSASDAQRIQWYLVGDLRHHWGVGGCVGFSDGPLPGLGEWYHVAWVNTAGQTLTYRDGELAGSQQNCGDVPVTDEPMYFGNRLPKEGRGEWWHGTLDEIGFWNRPLSAEEVIEVMDKGIHSLLAVSPQGKMATTWAALKARG